MADEIQAHHASVSVASGAMCASACFLLFAAGEHRTYETGARIGVHSVTSSNHLGPDDGDGTLAMARYAAHMGVPAGIVGEMVTTESTGIAWLSEDELAGMGAGPMPTSSWTSSQGFAFGGGGFSQPMKSLTASLPLPPLPKRAVSKQ